MTCEQYVIQNLMWKQCLTEDQFKQMANKCHNVVEADSRHTQNRGEEDMSAEELSEMVKKINRKLRNLHLQLSRGTNETDGTVYYALINLADNDLSRVYNRWTPKEIQYFRKLLATIVESEEQIISSMKALNIAREEDVKLSVGQAEGVLNKWMEQNWLEEVGDGQVVIGVRSLLEMNTYLRGHFAVQDCFRCKLLCIRGSNCDSCDIKMHFHCVDDRFIPNNKCPNCSKEWTASDRPTEVNERSVVSNGTANDSETEEEVEELVIVKPRRNSRQNSRRNESREIEESEEEDQVEESEEKEEVVKRRRRENGRRTRKAVQSSEAEEESEEEVVQMKRRSASSSRTKRRKR